MKCKCCGREKDLRLGYCFDCVEAESIIETGLDMYDEEIKTKDGLTKGMSKLQHILKNYIKIS